MKTDPKRPPKNHRHRWIALVGLSLLACICFLDLTIVYTALPAIQKAMDVTVLQLQWIINIFSLMLASLMIVMGHLGDLYGKRRLLYVGVFLFGVAALGAGCAQTFGWLIFFRGLQGVGAAITFTVAAALAPIAFSKEERSHAIGIYSAITGVGLAMGPFVGGVLVTLLNWRWVFFVNIPLILIGFCMCLGRLQESQILKTHRIDWTGFILLALSLGSLVYSIIHGEQTGWHTWITTVGFITALLGFAGFIYIEKRVEDPLIDFKVSLNTKILLGVTLCFSAAVIPSSILLFSPLYLNSVLNMSAFEIGLLMLVIPAMQVIMSLFWPILIHRFTLNTLIMVGFMACLFSLMIQCFFTLSTPMVLIVFAYLLVGIMWCVGNTGTVTLAYEAMPEEKAAGAVGIMFTAWNIGGAILIALVSVIFNRSEVHAMKRLLEHHAIHLDPSQSMLVHQLLTNSSDEAAVGAKLGTLSHTLIPLFKQAFLHGFHSVMLFSGVFILIGMLLAHWFSRKNNV